MIGRTFVAAIALFAAGCASAPPSGAPAPAPATAPVQAAVRAPAAVPDEAPAPVAKRFVDADSGVRISTRGRGGPISLDLEDADLAAAMRVLSRAVGHTILVDPAVHERVTLSLENVAWRDAVEVIARLTKCEITEIPPRRGSSPE